MSDERGDYDPPQGNAAGLKFRDKPASLTFKWVNYRPPAGNVVPLDFKGAYLPPIGSLVGLEFAPGDSGTERPTQYLFPVGLDATVFGLAAPRLQFRFVLPSGFVASTMGTAAIRNTAQGVNPAGFAAGAVSAGAELVLRRRYVAPTGSAQQLFGVPRIWNLRQIIQHGGFNAERFGTAFMSGGLKTIAFAGIAPPPLGDARVFDPKAAQTARPEGFDTLRLGLAHVSPQYLRPFGLLGTAMGTPQVQRNPSPAGFDSLRMGSAAIDYKTKPVRPAGLDFLEVGFPRILDRAQRLLHAASPVTAVFGDTQVRLKNYRIYPAGFDSAGLVPWTEVRNLRRALPVLGFDASALTAPQIRNRWPSLVPAGFDAAVVPGPANVGWRVRRVWPVGVAEPFRAVGTATVTQPPSLIPPGISSSSYGNSTVWFKHRALSVPGQAMSLWGVPAVQLRVRPVAPESIEEAPAGSPRVEHGNRSLLVLGDVQSLYGVPRVSFALHVVAPDGLPPVGLSRSHMVGGSRYLQPAGFVATRFGARVIPEVQQIYPLGSAEVFGQASVRLWRQSVAPASITTYPQPAMSWGVAKAWNRRQIVTMVYDPVSQLNPPAWPLWTAVANRTRKVAAFGPAVSVVPAPAVRNAARPVLPAGIAAPQMPSFYKAGMVAYRVRAFQMDGIEPVPMGRWGGIFNNARLLRAAGAAHALFGRASIASNRRTFNRIGNIDALLTGTPMVSFRVRGLSFEGRYTIGAPVLPLPRLHLYTRYVNAAGSMHSGLGLPAVVIHRNLITPRWTLVSRFGEASARNVTPEVRTRGRDSQEHGNASVRLQWRRIETTETFTQIFGRAVIADRRQRIQVAGANFGTVSDKLNVKSGEAPPFSLQRIEVSNEGANFGEFIDEAYAVPVPTMNQRFLRVQDTGVMTRFGVPKVDSNVLRIDVGITAPETADPFVSLKKRYLTVRPWEEVPQPSAPRLSPHTIWAVVEAPPQAIENHPSQALHYVGASEPPFRPGAIIGEHRISTYLGKLGASSVDLPPGQVSSGVGVALSRRYLKPTGSSYLRMGWHRAYDGIDRIGQYPAAESSLYGRPTVARGPDRGPRTARVEGIGAALMPAHSISLLNRQITVAGLSSLAMGDSRGDNPYAWQTLHVGPRMPTIPEGFNAERIGTAWVSLYIRGVEAQGFDAFLSEYDYQAFNQRMRVKNRDSNAPAPRTLRAQGRDCARVGTPGVRAGVHFIRPDGNSDQYRKGAF